VGFSIEMLCSKARRLEKDSLYQLASSLVCANLGSGDVSSGVATVASMTSIHE